MTKISADWLSRPATQSVCSALSKDGAQVLFVGGCVRNAVLQVEASDIDIATNVEPDKVMALAKASGIKAIPTGIDHGTVTLVLDGIAHEVTTFRKDVTTDGRRAVVAFSTDVAEDAARRDFTMNALYARPDGTVLDPLNGLPDLHARRVRFIGNATDRIREDYLRSLRYFRFHAWYGDADAGFDPDALSAIAENLDGLLKLSRERVGAELFKLLAAPDPAPALAAMRSTGVLGQVLPGTDDRAVAPLVHLEHTVGIALDPVRRLAALGGSDMAKALRLSKATALRLDQLRDAVANTQGAAELGFRLKFDTALDVILLRCALLEQPFVPGDLAKIKTGARANFPVSAKDLMPGFHGAALGRRLDELTTIWIASDFALSKELLLAHPGEASI